MGLSGALWGLPLVSLGPPGLSWGSLCWDLRDLHTLWANIVSIYRWNCIPGCKRYGCLLRSGAMSIRKRRFYCRCGLWHKSCLTLSLELYRSNLSELFVWGRFCRHLLDFSPSGLTGAAWGSLELPGPSGAAWGSLGLLVLKVTPGKIRIWNLRLRRPTPYPLRTWPNNIANIVVCIRDSPPTAR